MILKGYIIFQYYIYQLIVSLFNNDDYLKYFKEPNTNLHSIVFF